MKATGLAGFVDRYGDESAEVLWWAALAWIERAAHEAREAHFGRWRYYPRGELRRLRRDLLPALMLARAAVALQEEANEHIRELDLELRAEAERIAARARREQTREAERARLEKAARRRQKGP